ncbi:extracellular solute-binding protein [Mesobacillus subterraneus]|uniref:ABC transporter substrate-binding protein n=1 Tax=Mesobacillus subterraneus TaxID=285983 RepID=A0A0D6ZFY1_9BACI|nr:extracellular solute-binding protein [Mesobacillus subterraneus]KIY23518.1 ABC transporter substrate-binding protein [Mesobacillus subterraneus]
MKTKMLLIWMVMLLFLIPKGSVFAENGDSAGRPAENVIESRYYTILEQWEEKGIDSVSDFETSVPPSSFIGEGKNELLPPEESEGYEDRVFYWGNQKAVSFEVKIEKEGLYELSFDYFPISKEIVPIEGAILINGKFPFYESRRIVFPVQWKSENEEFSKDRFGNEIIPNQISVSEWSTVKAEDASYLQPSPLKFFLNKGKNIITLKNLRGEMLLGKTYIKSPENIPNYEEYKNKLDGNESNQSLFTVEAEKPYIKNSSFARPFAIRDSSTVPNDTQSLLLNSFGEKSWSTSGQRVNWKVDVQKDGYYYLTFKVKQNKETGGSVFRKVLIDGEIPFEEVAHYTFGFNKEWHNVTLGEEDGEKYLFYLTKGEHLIGLEADASPAERVVNRSNEVMKEIEELALSIKKLTGNQNDKARSWKITEFIPDIEDRVDRWANILEKESEYLQGVSRSDSKSNEVVSLKLAVEKLRTLNEKPDEIPNRMTELSEGTSSVAQLLGNLLLNVQSQPLLIDRFYVHGNVELPSPEAGFWKSTVDGIKRFFLSFSSGNYSASETDSETIEVWINRPRQYVELIQNMADRQFTPQTDIKVKFSIMPDEQKLILSSAANKQPDIALGISSWLPYELSIRGAAVDLKQFADFEEYSEQFSPGAFLPFMIDDSVYALPETQDFFVQFYRRDILEALNIPVPDSWEDVIGILPELQRFGMNYYTPIAGSIGFKPFQTTAPFIYQFQGDLYSKDGMSTNIDSEEALKAIQFMTDLNTIYSMPLQVPNFYNHFRYSTLPIGISSFQTYVQLTSAAPEIAGWWDIAPYPGVKQGDGTIERWATGSGQSAMIFKGTKNKEESWELLKWWLNAETQTEFASSLQTMYGPEYMWNTANLEAFANLPWPDEHKETILKQWKYLKEVPKTPGAYMVERELSNIWNRIVFDGENARSTVDDSVIAIDREISRKMEEFGYMKDGKIVRSYQVPSIEMVESWGRAKYEN